MLAYTESRPHRWGNPTVTTKPSTVSWYEAMILYMMNEYLNISRYPPIRKLKGDVYYYSIYMYVRAFSYIL